MTLDPQKPSTIWQAALPWFAKLDRWRLPIGEFGDQIVQAAVDALRLRYPSVTPDDRSLTILGKDRRIPRAPDETPEAYARRLNLWLDLWGLAGLPLGFLYAIQSYIFPGYPKVSLVERNGLWHTLNEGASRDLTPFEAMTVPSAGVDRYVPPVGASEFPRAEFWMHYGTWPDWDSISHPSYATRVHDYLLFVYQPSYDFQGVYDGDVYYDTDTCWGLDTSPGTIATLRELIKIYGRAGSHCVSVLFPNSTALYAPSATPDGDWPDGRWGWEAFDDGMGNVIPTRSPKNRYLLGFPGG
jgi:hypothetical protein